MGKAVIHYFSGTGNSLHAAELLGDEMRKFGYTTVFHAVEDGIFNSNDIYLLHIFFFPVYATAVPHIMIKYIKNLPDGKNVKAAVISTNGRISTEFRDGYQGWALHQARLYLKRRNYNVFFSDTLDYPHNMTIALPPVKPEKNRKIIKAASEKIPEMAEKIVKEQRFHRGFFWPNIIWSVPFGIIYSCFARHFFGKLLAADSKCNSCKLCVSKCPAKAMEYKDGQIRWKLSCEGCMRCINSCPKNAIQTSAVRLLAAFAAVILNPYSQISKIIPDTFYNSIGKYGSAIFNTLMSLLVFIVSLMLLDKIINLISKSVVIKKIVGWGHTRYYNRYTADQFKSCLKNKKTDRIEH